MPVMAVRPKRKEIIRDLTALLKESGERILAGESRLLLTTGCLALLNDGFTAIRDNDPTSLSFEVLPGDVTSLPELYNLQFLYDFVQKTQALKLIHGLQTLQGSVSIVAFRSLRLLEIRKTPLHFIDGIQKRRGHLRTIICSRCLSSLQELFESCGGDMSVAMSWPELTTARLAYNNIQSLDASLRLLPILELLDLSHNNIHDTENHLEYLTELRVLNLSYNVLERLPRVALSCRSFLATLLLRNNNLTHLSGLEEMTGLRELDLSDNCLIAHSDLEPLKHLKRLVVLALAGNPLTFDSHHRSRTAAHFHPLVANKVLLDGKKISKADLVRCHRAPPSGATAAFDQFSLPLIDGNTAWLEGSSDFGYDSTDTASVISVRQRRRRRRTRPASISDVDDMDVGAGSLDYQVHLPTAAPQASTPIPERHLDMKEKLERNRRCHGDDWLWLMSQQGAIVESGTETSETTSNDKISAENRITAEVEVHNSVDPVEHNEVDTVAIEEIPIKVTDEGEGWVKVEAESHLPAVNGDMNIDWNWTGERKDVDYGAECEPFIVAKAADVADQFLLTVTDRYVLEKDLDGDVMTILDFCCLRSFALIERTGAEECGPTVLMTFDYVKKNKRERIYILEDEDSYQRLSSLILPGIQENPANDSTKNMLQCLKCGVVFKDDDRVTSIANVQLDGAKNTQNLPHTPCPQCNSTHVVEHERQTATPTCGSLKQPKSLNTTLDETDNVSSVPKLQTSIYDTYQNSQTSTNGFHDDAIDANTSSMRRLDIAVSPSSFAESPAKSVVNDNVSNGDLIAKIDDKVVHNGSTDLCSSSPRDYVHTSSGTQIRNNLDCAPYDDGVVIKPTRVPESNSAICYDYKDFTHVDHRLKLQLMMGYFENNEDLKLVVKCSLAQNNKPEFPIIAALSSSRLRIFKIKADESKDHWLRQIHQISISSLSHVSLSHGGQSLRLAFHSPSVSLALLLRDECRCHALLQQFADFTNFSENISPIEPAEIERLQLVLTPGVDCTDDVDVTLVKFVMGYEKGGVKVEPISILLTPSHICMINEDTSFWSWPPDGVTCSRKSAQYTQKSLHALTDITSIDLYEDLPTDAVIHFVDEQSQNEATWVVAMETGSSLHGLVSSLREAWEAEFGVDLEINHLDKLQLTKNE